MAHEEPSGDGRFPSMPAATGSVTAQRRVLAAIAVVVGGVVFAGLLAVLGVTVAVFLAAVGAAGAVFTGGVLLTCRAYGHAVECATGQFCECERCGRPMDDRN